LQDKAVKIKSEQLYWVKTQIGQNSYTQHESKVHAMLVPADRGSQLQTIALFHVPNALSLRFG